MNALEGHNRIDPPPELAILQQWICWRYENRPGTGKPAKTPISPRTRRRANIKDSNTWTTYEAARAVAEEHGYDGVGFVFTEGDGYAGVDLDNCLDPQTGKIEPWAVAKIETLNSYTEISPSGTGVKAWVRGKLPGRGRHKNNVGAFDQDRYFAFTGRCIRNAGVEDRQGELEDLYQSAFPSSDTTHTPTCRPTVTVEDDDDLLVRARRAGNGERFINLFYRGNLTEYDEDHSAADLALCGMLAFWTGKDATRIDRLFRSSKLYRDKWERDDYREGTIRTAIAGCNNTYDPEPGVEPEVQQNLSDLKDLAAQLSWEGRSGPTDRSVFGELINTGGVYGKIGAGGVIVSASSRDLAVGAGVSDPTAKVSLQRLEKERKLIKCLAKGGPRKAATYLLLEAPSSLTHISTPPHCVQYEQPLRKMRNPAPTSVKQYDKNGRRFNIGADYPLGRIGKLAALVIEKVLHAPHGLTLSDLASTTNRRSDNLRRTLRRLVESGLLLECEGGYTAPADLGEKLETELEKSGCNEAEKRQRERHAREREAFINKDENPTEVVPPTPLHTKKPLHERGNDSVLVLTEEELSCLEAIRAWELKKGAFEFSQAMCKRMFYTGPVPGHWPTPEQAERIATYMDRRELDAA